MFTIKYDICSRFLIENQVKKVHFYFQFTKIFFPFIAEAFMQKKGGEF